MAVDMGYGHQRTAYPLRHLALDGEVINANHYDGIPENDKIVWERARKVYEFISRFKRIPFIGGWIFSLLDRFQEILSYYPKRDLSKSNIQLRQIYSLMKKGWGKHLILRLGSGQAEKSIPLITTFFITAFMAEYFDYPGDIFCIICDADISRTWAPLKPKESRIKYFVPTRRAVERLRLYGVRQEQIFFIGYPLPQELIGTEQMEILRENLKNRVMNLDPQKRYFEKYAHLIETYIGELPERADHPLTIMFSVGGAGAQKEIGVKVMKSLAAKIWAGDVKIILAAGTKEKVREYFERNLEKLKFKDHFGAEVLFNKEIEGYFRDFNAALARTDILWTKPSELSFYSALGLPIIISPPIGSQEEFNMRWLLKSGFGLMQENPKYASQWLFDWLNQGYLAEAAMEGFIEGEKLGTFNMQKICCG